MTSEQEHLTPKALAALELPDEERIAYINRDRWIGYPVAQEVERRLESLLAHPKVQRMPNLLLVGDTNNGKSSMVKRFARKHLGEAKFDEETNLVPVLYVEIGPAPDEDSFYSDILVSLLAPFKYSMSVAQKREEVYRMFRYVGVRLIIVDEIHNMLATRRDKQQALLNAIKRMGNVMQVPIVGVGIKDAARAIHTDPQMANRFEPYSLPIWRNDKDFLRFLVSFERLVPLKHPSQLVSSTLARKILAMSEGRLGEITQLLKRAAVHAVESRREKIDAKTLDDIDWVAPSKRRSALD